MLSATVLIRARDRRPTLAEVLRRLSAQTFPADRLEVVVVDHGSTDGTREMLRALKPPFRLHRVEVDPSVESRGRVGNAGLSVATGDVVIHLDSDVLPSDVLVEAHVQAHEAATSPVAVVGYVFGHGSPHDRGPGALTPPPLPWAMSDLAVRLAQDPSRFRDGFHQTFLDTRSLETSPYPWAYFRGANLSFSRRDALGAGGFDEAMVGWGWEDTELGYRLHRRGVAIRASFDAWGYHYPHPVDLAHIAAREPVNRRYFCLKWPDPIVELVAWKIAVRTGGTPPTEVDLEVSRQVGLEYRRLMASPPALAPAGPRGDSGARLLRSLRDRGFARQAWFGAFPDALAQELRPLFRSTPFAAERPAGVAGFAGLQVPFPGGEIDVSVAAGYWQALSPTLLALILDDLTRVSRFVVLADLQAGDEAAKDLAAEDPLKGAMAKLSRDLRCEALRKVSAAAVLLERL